METIQKIRILFFIKYFWVKKGIFFSLYFSLIVNTSFGQFSLEQKSSPAGIFSTTTQYFDNNASVTTQSIPERGSGYIFTHWEVNGTRINSDQNVSVIQVSFNLLGNTQAIAFYLPENEDSDQDGVPDWYEIREKRNLSGSKISDDDNDSLSLEEEVKFNLSENIPNQLKEGGISVRRSSKIFVNLGGARKLTLSSDPPGLISSRVSYPEVNSTFTSSNLSGLQNGFVFSHWEVNGIRQQDSIGMGLSKITQTMSEDKIIVAKFFSEYQDTDIDGLPDWLEWQDFGNLDSNSSTNTDNDNFSIKDERRYGISDLIYDNIKEGGISIRRSKKIQINLGRASMLTLSSNPPGIVPTQKVLYELNSTYNSSNLNGNQNGFIFSHWEINGIRQSDSAGAALSKVVETLDSDKNIKAIYIKEDLDSDGDGILDWFELKNFGTLNNNSNHDFDTDGFTLLEERKFGTNPLIKDTIREGGVSVRRTFRFSFAQGTPGQNDSFDSDGDGLTDLLENSIGSNKNIQDTDGDGFSDYAEWVAQSDLLNINDFPNQPPSSIDLNNSQILENSPIGSIVGRFLISDPNQNSIHIVSLVDGNGSKDNQLFSIDSNNSLRTNTVFDFETNSSLLSIRTQAIDQHNASIERSFQINILNIVEDFDKDGIEDHYDPDDDNDGFSDQIEIAYGSNPKNIHSIANKPPQNIDLNMSGLFENLPHGTKIGKFHIYDPDPNASTSLTFINDINFHNSLFEIDKNLSLSTNIVLDYETNASEYKIQVLAKDEHNGSRIQQFSIILKNIIEDHDKDGIEDYYDTDDDNDGYSDQIEIAYGSNPKNIDSIANKPPSKIDLNLFGLFENLPIGSKVGKFQIYDPDPNAIVSISIVNDKDINNSLFNIDKNHTLLTNTVLDYETNASKYTIQVLAKDEHNGSLIQQFSVELNNVIEDLDKDGIEDFFDPDDDNDGFSDQYEIVNGTDPRDSNSLPNHAPTGINLSNTSFLETVPYGFLVGKLTAIDPDTNSSHSFTLVDGNGSTHNHLFKIEQNFNLKTASLFRFQDNENTFSIRIKTTDEYNASLQKSFSLKLLKDKGQHPKLGLTSTKIDENGRVHFTTPLILDQNFSQIRLKPTFEEWVKQGEYIPKEMFFAGGSAWFNEETGKNRSSKEVYSLIFGNKTSTFPVFKYLLAKSVDFSIAAYSITALLENFALKASVFNLDANTTYFVRVETIFDGKMIISNLDTFTTPQSPVHWWESLSEQNVAGWRQSEWFGKFLPHKSGWIYHQTIGWLFVHYKKENDFWLWSSKYKWLWTKEGIYPFLFRNETSNWLYILGVKDGKAVFHDYSNESIE